PRMIACGSPGATMRLKLLFNAVAAALLATCALAAQSLAAYADRPLVVKIFETSDLHGALLPWDFRTDRPKATSLASVATLVRQARADRSQQVLLLDGGDNLQGQPLVYHANFMDIRAPHAVSVAFNQLDYDVVAVGNHDLEAGHAVYDRVARELKAGFVSANLVREADGQPCFAPYKVVDKGGVRIAVLGLTEPAFVRNFPKALYPGIRAEDMVACARKWVPIIREKEHPDVLLGLFHAGLDAAAGLRGLENSSQLVVQSVPGFDAIFVGHDHAGWDGQGYDPVTKTRMDVLDPEGRVVPIYGATDEARKIPVVTMTLRYDRASRQLRRTFQGGLVDMAPVAPDPELMQVLQAQAERTRAWVDRPIGRLAVPLRSRDALFGDSAFVDLIHTLQLALTRDPALGLKPAQLSFCAPLSPDAAFPASPDGTIRVRDMFSLYAYENWLCTMDLTGRQVKDYLEASCAGWFNTMTREGDHLIAFDTRPDGSLVPDGRSGWPRTRTASYNYDSAAGLVYEVDVRQPAGRRLAIRSLADGTPFSLDARYTVALNSYRAMGGGGLLERGAHIPAADLAAMKRITSTTTQDLRFHLTRYLEARSGAALKPEASGNWKLLPEAWVRSGRALDEPLLFPGTH
ncbi:MAG TPA: bifunctional UDP-sugar hydrolase/5'-nucleotidase, partial [Holophaga sp.]|nr:bifunctional UDP-sugar hydrolase/5'-nucleotidase [Holophaga sp.]